MACLMGLTFCHQWRFGRSSCRAWRWLGLGVCSCRRLGGTFPVASWSYRRASSIAPWIGPYTTHEGARKHTTSLNQRHTKIAKSRCDRTYWVMEAVSEERCFCSGLLSLGTPKAKQTVLPFWTRTAELDVTLAFLKFWLDLAIFCSWRALVTWAFSDALAWSSSGLLRDT